MDQGWAAAETSDAEAVAASLETLKVADRLGFDSAWIGEHHQVRAEAPFLRPHSGDRSLPRLCRGPYEPDSRRHRRQNPVDHAGAAHGRGNEPPQPVKRRPRRFRGRTGLGPARTQEPRGEGGRVPPAARRIAGGAAQRSRPRHAAFESCSSRRPVAQDLGRCPRRTDHRLSSGDRGQPGRRPGGVGAGTGQLRGAVPGVGRAGQGARRAPGVRRRDPRPGHREEPRRR